MSDVNFNVGSGFLQIINNTFEEVIKSNSSVPSMLTRQMMQLQQAICKLQPDESQKTIGELQKTIEELQKLIEDLNAEIEDLNAEIEDLNKEITRLQCLMVDDAPDDPAQIEPTEDNK